MNMTCQLIAQAYKKWTIEQFPVNVPNCKSSTACICDHDWTMLALLCDA